MRWLVLTVVLLVVATVAAFTIQNSGRTVELSLDLGFAAWKLARPATASAVVWGSFGAGFALAFVGGFFRRAALTRRVRQLEQQLALAGPSSGTSSFGSPASSSPATPDWRG